MPNIQEWRGCTDLVYAEVIKDDATGYATGTVKELAGVAEISKTTNSSQEAHYYNNQPAIIISSEGTDEITLSVSAIPYDVLADITGQYYDNNTGMLVEGNRKPKMFALGYKTSKTDGTIVYVWRLRGMFSVPDQTNATIDDGTDANGQELTYTGINTNHKFKKNNDTAKSVVIEDPENKIASASSFFDSVQTPDTVAAKVVTPSVSVVPSRLVLTAGESAELDAIVQPAGTAVSWASSAATYASVANGVVSALEAGSATITASITVDGNTYTDTCAVTVNAIEA